jgi:hypothetical protein
MRSDRLARALLRLYPLEWRERYGDELLALVIEFGLTWRSAFDIVRAAIVERVRTLIGLARAEADATPPLPEPTPETGRETILTPLGFAAMVSVLILACNQFGVGLPRWMFWLQLFFLSNYFDSEGRMTRATIGERIVLTFVWFVLGLCVTIAGWLLGMSMRGFGVPEPSAGIVFGIPGVILVAGAGRASYRGMASALNKPRPDLTDREMRGWHVAMFSIHVLFGMVTPTGEVVWPSALMSSVWMRSTRIRHVRAERRRQLREQRGF